MQWLALRAIVPSTATRFFGRICKTIVTSIRSGYLVDLPPASRTADRGYIVIPEAAQAMATKVIDILEDPEQASLMGKRGQRIAQEKFNIESSVHALEEVYSSVLEQGASALVHPFRRSK